MRSALNVFLPIVMLAATGAHAQGKDELEPSVVFFEMYMRGDTATKTPEYVNEIQKAIPKYKKYSVLARADAAKRIRAQMVTPTKRVNDEKLKQIEKMVAEGDKLLYTTPAKAIDILRKAKEELKEIVENITLDAKVRKEYFTTQMLLARSHFENGNAEKAKEIMIEVVRTFEDEYPVTEDNYHPRVVELYKDTFRSLKDQRTASITVTSNPDGCEVFINGRARRERTPFTYKGLYPGPIHIQVTKGDLQSMVRKIEVPSGGLGKIDIDLEYESALSFSDEAFGLTFSDRGSMTRNMLNYAAKLGGYLDVDYVVFAGQITTDAGPALAVYQFNVKERKLVRQKDFEVKANVVSNRRVIEAAGFLCDVDVNATIGKIYKPAYKNWLGWTLTGVGLALALGAIGPLTIYLDKSAFASDINLCGKKDAAGKLTDNSACTEAATDGQTMGRVAGTLAGIGGAVIIGGIVAFFVYKIEDTDAMSADADDLQPRAPRFTVAPWNLPGGGGVFTELRF